MNILQNKILLKQGGLIIILRSIEIRFPTKHAKWENIPVFIIGYRRSS